MSALVLPWAEHTPRLGARVFLAPNATVIGDVILHEDASVWFCAVLRGDCGSIEVGPRTNVQDGACLHMTEGVSDTRVGADVTVGHGAILHGCTVEDRCLVGMGSTILDGAVIGAGSVVAAGSLVPPRLVVPPGVLVRGNPARVVRAVTEAEARLGVDGAVHYLDRARRYAAALGGAA